jgi:transcription initiation protein SPT3
MDILGFLAFEIVSVLTEYGLLVKTEWERDDEGERQGGVVVDSLFAPPPMLRTPLMVKHIREGFRRRQVRENEMQNYQGYFVSKPLVFI